MEAVLADLRSVPEASPLINSINKRGSIQLETQPLLLEARVAHELHHQGIQFDYEYKTGVGGSSVDFRIRGAPEFLIEVVSLRTSKGVKEASYDQGDWFGFSMSSENLYDEKLARRSEEFEIIVAQGKLGEKVRKFPEPKSGRFHIIVADVRGLMAPAPAGAIGIGDLKGDLDLITYGREIFYSSDGHPEALPRYIPQADGTNRRIQGIFEDGADRPRSAPILRKRIHAIHFVCEESFEPGEIITCASRVIPNIHLTKSAGSWGALTSAYPLVAGSA